MLFCSEGCSCVNKEPTIKPPQSHGVCFFALGNQVLIKTLETEDATSGAMDSFLLPGSKGREAFERFVSFHKSSPAEE